ncbi:hypothetical protein NDI44_27645 [Trichocoleus sp. DQ-A3]|uniref:hypothetical protein n=1 Tax=Cyanophyceae TaxID=3028117 RepID=UPI00168915AE|nr:hypothetical protein [Coleofasciculus sp. FACHB-125]MBD1903671.1 hypothetical protein [Coleofasciculus sp. FACHB-125]
MKSVLLTAKSIFNFFPQVSIKFEQHKEIPKLHKTELMQEPNDRFYQANVAKSMKRLQDNYFLERRTFL